jgi:hypothetical protein
MKNKQRVYISGAMSGVAREHYLARFDMAERILKNEGWRVVNPARLAPCRWPWLYRLLGYRLTLLYDLWHLMKCDGIVLLKGWNKSKGARLENATARIFKLKELWKE